MELSPHPLIEILLVEDNQDDVVITRKGFESSEIPVKISAVENGRECMSYLKQEPPYEEAALPDLILLDLNMPVMDGRAVLSEIVQHQTLRSIPVIVLTTSAAEQDLLQMYQLRCSSYIRKPVDFDDFLEVVRAISDYWFKTVERPPKAP